MRSLLRVSHLRKRRRPLALWPLGSTCSDKQKNAPTIKSAEKAFSPQHSCYQPTTPIPLWRGLTSTLVLTSAADDRENLTRGPTSGPWLGNRQETFCKHKPAHSHQLGQSLLLFFSTKSTMHEQNIIVLATARKAWKYLVHAAAIKTATHTHFKNINIYFTW